MKPMVRTDPAQQAIALAELLDKESVRETMARYCRAVDRCDVDLARSCFHPDATLEIEDRVLAGPDAVAAFVVDACLERSSISMHCITNHLVEIDGDEAAGEFYFVSWYVIDADGRQFTRPRGGRYLPRLRRFEDTWRIVELTVVSEWVRKDEITDPWPFPPNAVQGRRSREDPVYRLMRDSSAG